MFSSSHLFIKTVSFLPLCGVCFFLVLWVSLHLLCLFLAVCYCYLFWLFFHFSSPFFSVSFWIVAKPLLQAHCLSLYLFHSFCCHLQVFSTNVQFCILGWIWQWNILYPKTDIDNYIVHAVWNSAKLSQFVFIPE